MPVNGFSFDWNTVEHDALVGYQLYVDSFPLMRTTDTSLTRSYNEMEDSLVAQGVYEGYFWINKTAVFYVTALYGANEKESIESDKLFRRLPWATPITSHVSLNMIKAPFIQKRNTISLPKEFSGKISLFTLQGQEILNRAIQSGGQISLNGLPTQIYILSLRDQNSAKQYRVLKH